LLVEYDESLLKNMRALYVSLSEKDRRRYAAVEAKKLGHGGIVYIATLFGCMEKTIRKGLLELESTESMKQAGIRRTGAGRPSSLDKLENIDALFLDVLREHTAGDPMDEKVKWSNLTRSEISQKMAKRGIKVSKNIIKKLLKKHGYVKRKALKKTATGEHKERDQQFNKIAGLRNDYENSKNPIISIDAKKKNSSEIYTEKDKLSALRL
jgi:hypothetical protein